MPHIHTDNGHHDLTASAIIIRTDTPEPTTMLHMHKKLNKFLQFGGHVELDETPWQAINHELKEESGYDLSQLYVLQPEKRVEFETPGLQHPIPVCLNTHPFNDEATHFHTDLTFALTTDQAPASKPAEGESVDIRLFTKKELLALPESDIHPDIRNIIIFVMDECMKTWEKVPTSKFGV